jgi:Rieske Fe-S protein
MEGLEADAKTYEVPEGDITVMNLSGPDVMVDVGGPLGKGKLAGSVIECPWHGSKFDVKTGAVISGPAQKPEPTFQVKVENSAVWIKKP